MDDWLRRGFGRRILYGQSFLMRPRSIRSSVRCGEHNMFYGFKLYSMKNIIGLKICVYFQQKYGMQ
ncbi:unnamed protein product [Sphenostylis stenocarpa]|uniref:Uncharacterized protein n=1 Tax=Sphenostylis stenocarpa TaxID=92480 RepID=A0AA86S863_9FABA|nr:unnamed protein product [Sphenostylis stenocarpa]